MRLNTGKPPPAAACVSDLTDAEWALEPMIAGASAARRERPRGAQRDLLCSLDGLPVVGAAQGPAAEVDGTSLLHAVGLGRHARAHPPRALCGGTRPGRARGEPIGGGDRQPERQGSAKRGASLDPQGFDAGKKVTGRKRHILVDTLGLLLSVIVHPADVQDRDGARELLRTARRSFPFIETIVPGAEDGGDRRHDRLLEAGNR